jgi:hypothetical protein
LLLFASINAYAGSTTGKIEGVVTDKGTGKPLAGVTVVVTAVSLQGEQADLTAENGHYLVTELPPGEYTVRFYYSDVVVERSGIVLNADKTLRLNLDMPTQGAKETVYVIKERAPSVDVGSAQVQTQLTKDVINNTPVAGGIENRRNYDSALALAPTASYDVNPNFSGSTGNENAFLIDGLNTTQIQRGFLGTQLTLEFVQETDVVIAGYNAEYGRSTGAVVNVVTKSGSNEFHGGTWFYASPYQLNPPLIAGLGEAIATTSKRAYTIDFGVDMGGPVVKDKLWFYVGFAPTYNEYENTTVLRERLATNVPTTQTSGTYAGDQKPGTSSCPSYMASTLLCPAGTSAVFATRDIPGQTTIDNQTKDLYNWIAKFDYRPARNHNISLTYIGSPTTTDGTPGGTGDVTTRQYSDLDNIHDLTGRVVSKVLDHKLQLDLVAGIHYEDYAAAFPTVMGNSARVSYTATMPLSAFRPQVTDCDIQTIHGVTFNPCPVTGYSTGGFGSPFATQTAQRYATGAGATYFLERLGTHALKVGADFDDATFENRPYYTGGALYRVTTAGVVQKREFAAVNAQGAIADLPGGYDATTTTFNETLYARDSWNVGFIRDLTLNLGIRWEGTQLHAADGSTIFSITDNIAPRAGFAYDFSHKGLARIYANYGRYYEAVPLTLNDDQFATHSFTNYVSANPGSCAPDPVTKLVDTSKCTFRAFATTDVNNKTYPTVQPDLKGQYINEIVAGTQFDVGWDTVLGAAYVHRDMGRAIEDAAVDGSQNFIIGNPGDDLTPQIQQLQRQIANTTDPMQLSKLQYELMQVQGLMNMPKPKRDYDAMVLTAQKRLTNHLVMLGSYTYSRTVGNMGGLYDPTYGAHPNTSFAYNYRDLMVNADGPLPTDRPHNFKLSAGWVQPLRTGTLSFGAAYFLASGAPINVMGIDPYYTSAIIFILPRGSGGRTPTVGSLALHAGYARPVGQHMTGELYADVFNALNQQEVTSVNQLYTSDPVLPIAGGTAADLRNLRNVSNSQPVVINPNYGQPTSYQPPLTLRFGVRARF